MPRRYDRIFKTFAEEDPRGLLQLFGSLPLDAEAEVQIVDRELGLPVLIADHVYRIRTAEREWLAHFEAQTYYEADMPERLAWYATALALKFKLPVESVLVLLAERYAPAEVPAEHALALGGISIHLQFRVIRLWQVDAEAVLAAGRQNLLPWVALMDATPQELREAARRIAGSGSGRFAAEFMVLGGLRYDKDELAALLGRLGNMLTYEQLKASSVIQHFLEEGQAQGREEGREEGREVGRQEGLQEGLQEGREEEARRSLRIVLASRFPSLERMPELDHISDLRSLEDLLVKVTMAETPESARAAIQTAVSAS